VTSTRLPTISADPDNWTVVSPVAIDELSDLDYGRAHSRGDVFTRRWIVKLILDLCGYDADKDLSKSILIEPSVGDGAFLREIVDRLLISRARLSPDMPWDDMSDAIRAVDLHAESVHQARQVVLERLAGEGCPSSVAMALARRWIVVGDFLLDDWGSLPADFIIGNPPYIRIEDLPPDLLVRYRAACPTMGGRADIYVGFYERSLDSLKPGGTLGFICADRWMRNQYGRKLRTKIVEEGFAVDACLVMHNVKAFENDVSAYPAITIIRRGSQASAVVGTATETFDALSASDFACWSRRSDRNRIVTPAVSAAEVPHWHTTADSWPDATPEALAWLEDLSDRFQLLEDDAGHTRIGIGVATGADSVYVTTDPRVAEPERMLPLVMSTDIKSGKFNWSGHYLVSPWDEQGLVDIDDWPLLKQYLQSRATHVTGRAIAKKYPRNWYRTIDRVNASLTLRPKLVLEDLKAAAHPVLEPGGHYPHHNLYYVTSDLWDLEVLGGILLSDVVTRQISAYCVKMRGQTLRFQAQYLRRVRVPNPGEVPSAVQDVLAEGFRTRNRVLATEGALAAFSIDHLPE
jgi:hypothetical protein